MSINLDSKPQPNKKVKSKGKSKSGVSSIALAVARDKIRSMPWSGDWQAPLTQAIQPVARDVVAGRVERTEYQLQLQSAARASMGSDEFDAIADTFEFITGNALTVEIEKRDAEIAATEIVPDAEQPSWLPAEGDFFVSHGGIYRNSADVRGASSARRVSSLLEICARFTGAGYGWIVKINGAEVQVPANIAELRAAELTALLVGAGLRTDESPDRHDDLLALFKRARPAGSIKIVSAGGWQTDRKTFVLPDAAYGPGSTDTTYRIERTGDHRFGVAGTFTEWQDRVSLPCVGNPLLVFAMSVAAAAPFAGTTSSLPGFFHIEGQTSSGKSTALHVAGSFWGGSTSTLGYAQSWNTTSNALIGRAIQHNDCLMCLDELGTSRAKDVSESVYQISMGQGRARMKATQRGGIDNAVLERFNALALSTGELSIEAKIAEGGGTVKGGQDVRAINVIVGDDTGLPIFEALHGSKNARAFADRIGSEARNIYGHAGRLYVERIADDFAKAQARVDEIAAAWMAKYVDVIVGLPSDMRRAASRFAAVVGAGEYAAEIGVLPWEKGEAFKGIAFVFGAWLGGRKLASKDIVVGEDKLRTYLARNEAKFASIEPIENPNYPPKWKEPPGRVGVMTYVDRVECYAISQEVLRHELRDVNVPALLKHLAKEGVVKRGDAKNITRKVNTPEGRSRLVCIARSFVHGDDEPEHAAPVDDGKAF